MVLMSVPFDFLNLVIMRSKFITDVKRINFFEQ